ncbi:MAG: ribonuclease H-like domain-containing protein [Eubacteriales bacterium]|nr:ribonuclease H-like domain-containing protein [Eubacteriales bacterium]
MYRHSIPVNYSLAGTLWQGYEPADLLFFDIETTGFLASSSSLYLIGAVTWQDGRWMMTQWLAQTPSEEDQILKDFLSFAGDYRQIVHFNGDRFDLPYLNEKCSVYGLSNSLSRLISRDLYRTIRPLKKLLNLSALNQRSLEEWLGLQREDPYDGGELISVYKQYAKVPSEEALHSLLLHNQNDLEGMLALLPILSYLSIPNGSFRVENCEIAEDALLVYARLALSLPRTFSYQNDFLYVTGSNDRIAFKVKGLQGTLKYFYKDYKNYCYLPEEDIAIHKSVAAFVDAKYREPAKASTCFGKKEGFYLPQKEAVFTPVFQKEYKSRPYYFACKEQFPGTREELHDYLVELMA